MKAFIYTRFGPPEVLKFSEVVKPEVKEGEVLVRVHATSVNRTDCANLRAKPAVMRLTMGLFKPRKQILGTEFAGVVEAAGHGVTRFKPGDRVFGFDDNGLQSYAEYLVISEGKAMATIPDHIPFTQAAGCLEGAHYAFNFLNKVQLKKTDEVLVNGASGGIGTATVQLLKHYGVDHITAVCNTRNTDLVRSLGAEKVIDYTKEDFTKAEGRFDLVLDSVGKSSFGECADILKPGGVYISSELGKQSQNLFFSLVTAVFGSLPGQSGKKVKFPFPADKLRSVQFVQKLLEKGEYRPVIDRVYPFKEIPDAFRYVETGQKAGNVTISMEISK